MRGYPQTIGFRSSYTSKDQNNQYLEVALFLLHFTLFKNQNILRFQIFLKFSISSINFKL